MTAVIGNDRDCVDIVNAVVVAALCGVQRPNVEKPASLELLAWLLLHDQDTVFNLLSLQRSRESGQQFAQMGVATPIADEDGQFLVRSEGQFVHDASREHAATHCRVSF